MLFDFTSLRPGILLLASCAPALLWFFWYGPLFGKRWLEENGITNRALKRARIVRIFLMSFAGMYVSAALITLIANGLSVNYSVMDVVSTAFIIGLGAVAALTLIYQFAQRSNWMLLIDSTYFLLSYLAMGLVIGWLT